VLLSTSLVAPNTHAGFSTTIIPTRMTTTRPVYKFGATRRFCRGEYSLDQRTERQAAHVYWLSQVAPVLLSVDLINSFELEM